MADDNAGDILTVVEALDGVVLRTITSAVRGQSYTLTVPALAWRKPVQWAAHPNHIRG